MFVIRQIVKVTDVTAGALLTPTAEVNRVLLEDKADVRYMIMCFNTDDAF